jgi:hypothetical protein
VQDIAGSRLQGCGWYGSAALPASAGKLQRASGESVRWKHHLTAREDETRLSAERISASLSTERTPFPLLHSAAQVSARACLLSLAELKAGPVWVHECAAANFIAKPSPFVEPRIMDGIFSAASIIAVIDISAKIASLCF